MREVTFAEAIREAMCEEMRRDKTVFLMGEDIGVYNGPFGVSEGMITEFGPDRILETPLSETAFVGAGVGAAMMGMRPIVELMFSDFIGVCYDQILNQAAKLHFMFGGKTNVPMVLRASSGGGTGAAAQHSQSLENLLCHVPGLKVVMPCTPFDAKGLLISSIRDNNPVVFLEPKLLYSTKGEVPEEEYSIPLGLADKKREGTDISIITYGRTVQLSLEAASRLEKDGISTEVLDLRTLYPLDREAIIKTAEKTGRVVVVHEAVLFGGFGGEIVSTIVESEAFFKMKAPIKRVGALHSPVPFSKGLESQVLPSADSIENTVRSIL